MINVCSFKAEVKGVMLYDGREDLRTDRFVHAYIKSDTRNEHHCKAYFVKLCCNKKILGHLSANVAEAVYGIQYKEGIDTQFPL